MSYLPQHGMSWQGIGYGKQWFALPTAGLGDALTDAQMTQAGDANEERHVDRREGRDRRGSCRRSGAAASEEAMSNYVMQQLGATQSFRYHDEAIAVANKKFAATPSAEFVVVTFDALGRNPVAMPFSTSRLANEAFNDVIDAPGSRVYAAVIDREDVSNEWFGSVIQVTQSWFTKEKLKQLAPWILGGAVIIAGAIYYSKNKRRAGRSRAASARKVRRAISWRRPTVTTWR
jgi:hypothetical protein